MKIQRVDLSSIDLENGKYRVGQSLYSKDLTKSLKKVGQINPITLVVENDRYIVVNGWKRMEALIEAGETYVYANVLDETEFSNLELMLLNYFDNRQRYTELDKASMLDKVRELCHFNDDELLPILEVLSIKPSLNNLRKYLSVASLPPEFKELFYSDYFSLPIQV